MVCSNDPNYVATHVRTRKHMHTSPLRITRIRGNLVSVFRRQDCYTTCHEDLCNDSEGVPGSSPKKATEAPGGVQSRTRTSYPLPAWKDSWDVQKDRSAGVVVSSSSLLCSVLLLFFQL